MSPPKSPKMQRRPRVNNEAWASSSLDSSGCLTLHQIVGSFSAPISEEQAWAIIYESVRTLDLCLANPFLAPKLYIASSLDHVLVHEDGHVHESSFILNPAIARRGDRAKITSENKALSELGLVIFTALDFGLGDDQERKLSSDLEAVLEVLASEEHSRDEDEGIDEDAEHITKSGLAKQTIQICACHLALESEAPLHFRAVCRALVSESLELSNFMEKVKQHETETSDELKELDIQDWARLWRQILKDLRNGVKLKKVDYTKTPVEYELTPYEILMEDIKARKYSLNKVMIDGELPPRIKKDAHDIILHFIKSRPPLKPAFERQLQPARKESTPIELLMESIRNTNPRTSLRKTGGPPRRTLMNRLNSTSSMESSRTKIIDDDADEDLDEDLKGPRKKVTLDPSLLDDLLNFSDDESEDDLYSKKGSLDSVFSATDSSWNLNNNKEADDSCAAASADRGAGHQRRHSLTVCETPKKVPQGDLSCQKPRKPPDLVFSTQVSKVSTASSGSATPTSEPGSTPRCESPDVPALSSASMAQMQARLHAEFLQSEHWATALQTLDLTLDEVVHIRSVLTKAELEGLPLDGSLKDDVEKGKVCFLCMKTRFGFFNRGCKCELCSRQVCTRCSTKMRIPLEHFSATPVISLSPNVDPNQEARANHLTPFNEATRRATISAGSAPTSPATSRRKTASMIFEQSNLAINQPMSSSLTFIDRTEVDDEYDEERKPQAAKTSMFQRFSASRISQRTSAPANQQDQTGPQRQICMDCKEMVLQVVRAQSTAKRLQMAKSIFQQQLLSTNA